MSSPTSDGEATLRTQSDPEGHDGADTLRLLLWVLQERDRRKENYVGGDGGPITDQELGAYQALSAVEKRVREMVEPRTCTDCGEGMEIKEDGRFSSGFCWSCPFCARTEGVQSD